MLTIHGPRQRFCDGLSRRDFLRAGALGVGGITLADLLRSDALAKDATAGTQKRPKSIIYVVLSGGPSHIDMWDLKPQAPLEYCGPFTPMATSLPGVQICEHMPRQAEIMHRTALIRGIRSVENDHFLSEVYTGLPRTAGKRPAFGCVANKLLENNSPLPTYVSTEEASVDQFEFEKPYYLGAGYAPFRPFQEALSDLTPVKDRTLLEDRKSLLHAFDAMARRFDRPDAFGGIDRFQAQAMQMIASPQVRDAFDLSREPQDVLERYGHKNGKYTHQTAKQLLYDWDAKPFVFARRLVEAGVRVVTVRVGAWDHHSGPQSNIFYSLQTMMPPLDRTIVALVNDLKDRGLEDDVLVVMLGEFGRTPKISPLGPGREHWADAGCALFYGGGLKMGQVIGETDSRAEQSKDGKITFQNIMATMYHVLGIDPALKIPDFNGRPQYLLNDWQPIPELMG